jgi:2-dehydro-3-deoxyphosphogluconate aldolase/(4S)-4-hydroxy-2-oxoglutarate aldolase
MPSFSSEQLLVLLREHPIVPVYYNADIQQAQTIVQACYDGGLRLFEFTNRGDMAFSVFSQLVEYVRVNCPGMAMGIGTILTPDDAERFMDAGADFVVQPVTTAAIGKICQTRGIPWIPAGSTLNEIYQATQLGADVVKVFPGNVVGPGFIKAVLGPMPHLKLMVTGGVEPNVDSLTTWFKAGVTAVGIGSQLFSGPSADPSALRDRIAALVQHTTTLTTLTA